MKLFLSTKNLDGRDGFVPRPVNCFFVGLPVNEDHRTEEDDDEETDERQNPDCHR